MNKKSLFLTVSVLALGLGTAAWKLALPVQAEQPPAIKYEVTELDDRKNLMRIESARVDGILKAYGDKMYLAEKIDNEVRAMLIESNMLKFEDLSNFLDKKVLPKSQELLSVAGGITSESSALRSLHDIYLEYITERHQALTALATFAREKAPKTVRVREYEGNNWHGSYSSFNYSNTDEHIPHSVYERVASYRQQIAQADTIRNRYYNKKDYIKRNKLEVIGEEK